MSISVSPVHSIYEYANGIYKVVTFKGSHDPDNAYLRTSEAVQHNDTKLDTILAALETWCCNTLSVIRGTTFSLAR